MTTLFFFSQLVLVPAFSPLLWGSLQKLEARIEGRKGASVLQPYRDLLKLFQKDEVIPSEASWLFCLIPIMLFSLTVLLGVSVPVFSAVIPAWPGLSGINFLPLGDFLVIVYLLALGTFLLALAGFESGTTLGGVGAARRMFLGSLSQAGLLFSLLVASVIAQTGNVFGMVANFQLLPLETLFPLIIAFVAFMLALLAENSCFPVGGRRRENGPGMIHEALTFEYSGKRLALLEWATANKLLIFVALGANVFFPWGMALELSLSSLMLFSAGLFFLKAFLILFVIVFIEATMAKLRIFRVPDLLFTSLVLGIVALAVTVTF